MLPDDQYLCFLFGFLCGVLIVSAAIVAATRNVRATSRSADQPVAVCYPVRAIRATQKHNAN